MVQKLRDSDYDLVDLNYYMYRPPGYYLYYFIPLVLFHLIVMKIFSGRIFISLFFRGKYPHYVSIQYFNNIYIVNEKFNEEITEISIS